MGLGDARLKNSGVPSKLLRIGSNNGMEKVATETGVGRRSAVKHIMLFILDLAFHVVRIDDNSQHGSVANEEKAGKAGIRTPTRCNVVGFITACRC